MSSPAILAHHLLEAGSLVERDVRVAAGLRAGRHSVVVGAFEDAASWVERVAALVTEQVGPRDRAELALLRCDVERAHGNRAEAIAAVRDAAGWARDDRRPDAPRPRGRGLDDVAVGASASTSAARPTADLVDADGAGDRRAPARASGATSVRMRSMLASVLVPDHDPTRRLELADEAMAIAAETDEDELVGVGAAGPAARAVAARPARRAPRR